MATKSQEVSLFGDKSESLPAYMRDDAGLGNENASGSALATPQIKLLQALSPELRDQELKAKGADVGKLFDNVSREIFSSIIVANVYFEAYYTVWKDRKKGGGKFGEFATEAEAMSHIASLDQPDDYACQETHKHYLVQLDGNTGEPLGGAVVYMKSTQLGPSRAWNTEINKKNGPRFASIWELSSVTETSRNNDEYANYSFSWKGWASQELYEAIKPMYQSMAGQQQQTA